MKNFILGLLVATSFSAVAFEKVDMPAYNHPTYEELKEQVRILKFENDALWVSMSIGGYRCKDEAYTSKSAMNTH